MDIIARSAVSTSGHIKTAHVVYECFSLLTLMINNTSPELLLYRLYEWTIEKLDSSQPLIKILRVLAENIMKFSAKAVSSQKKIQFPMRALGSSWWIWRWRFDFVFGLLEFPSMYWCKRVVKPGMVAVDVGAHIGYYTRLLSKLVGENGKVIAFEPSPENFPVLTQNMYSLPFRNTELYEYAVDDRNAVGQLHISPGHSNHSLIEGYTDEQGIVSVKTVTLDAFLEEKGVKQIDFIKIDVEGNEPHVLAGMRNIVRSSANLVVLIEYNPPALRSGRWEPEKLVFELKEMGFTVFLILADGSLAEDIFQCGENTVNLLCKKTSGKWS